MPGAMNVTVEGFSPSSSSTATGLDADKLAALNSMLVGVSLLTVIGAGFLINTNRIRNVPESSISMVLGFLVGLVALSIDHIRGAPEERRVLMFQPQIFFYLLLPPIVFEAGFAADRRIFVNNLGSILSFAVLGTFISTIVVAEGLYQFGVSNRLECYLFGSLISATDPVATIALFGSPRFASASDPTFHCLVFGESLLNDAVAVVLFAAFERRFQSTQKGVPDTASLFVEFMIVSVGSVMIGIIAGLACSWCFRRVHPMLHQFPAYEVSATFFAAYLAYAIAQYMDLSGITALFFCGIVLSKYNWYNLSDTGKTSSKVAFRTLSMISESLVFCYLGVFTTFSLVMERYHWNVPLIIASLLLVACGRALHVFPLAKILNVVRVEPIRYNAQVMMWFSGLRGAVSFALALRLPVLGCNNAGNFVTTTIAIVVLTTLMMGSALESVARKLGLIDNSEGGLMELDPNLDGPSTQPMIGHSLANTVERPPREARTPGQTLFSRSRVFPRGLYHEFALWDKDVLQRIFGGKYGWEEDKSTELQTDILAEDDYAPCWSRSVIFE